MGLYWNHSINGLSIAIIKIIFTNPSTRNFGYVFGFNLFAENENVVTGIPNLKTTHYVIPEDIFKNSAIPKDVSNKFKIHSYENMAGGIDPNTGYSRRIISYLENRNKINQIDQGKIQTPNYSQFVAANMSTSDLGSTRTLTDWEIILIIIFSIIGLIIIGVFVYQMYKKYRSKVGIMLV